jgi:type IV pilus assembly protein PilB
MSAVVPTSGPQPGSPSPLPGTPDAIDRSERVRLGERLVRDGLLSPSQLRIALAEQQRGSATLGAVLVTMGFLRAETLAELRAEELGIPFVHLATLAPDPALLAEMPADFARQHGVFPVRREGEVVVVALERPVDILVIDALKRRFWRHIKVVAAAPRDIASAIRRHLDVHAADGGPASGSDAVLDAAKDGVPEDIVALTNTLIEDGLRKAATDIHVEPEEGLTRIRYRIDGLLEQGDSLSREVGTGVLARIKILSGLDITERRLPQDGRIGIVRPNGRVDLRVSIMPTCHGENAVLRVLDRSAISLNLDDLGIAGEDRATLERIIGQSSGMLLVSGPTGSGKTSTLYALLLAVDSLTRKIITIEDPIEYQLPLIRQSQVDAAIDYHFKDGLRASLRQDPDVILIGEIRDQETADTALKASLTGHLVLSSIHTNSAVGVITRLLDLGVDRYLLGSSLTGAMAQRLVRRVCGTCGTERPATVAEASFLGGDPATLRVRAGTGCRACRGTGYSGRLALYELFLVDQTCQAILAAGGGEHELAAHGRELGTASLADDGRRKVLAGLTTVTEVLRVCPSTVGPARMPGGA